jgi:hypothetical protein
VGHRMFDKWEYIGILCKLQSTNISHIFKCKGHFGTDPDQDSEIRISDYGFGSGSSYFRQ